MQEPLKVEEKGEKKSDSTERWGRSDKDSKHFINNPQGLCIVRSEDTQKESRAKQQR